MPDSLKTKDRLIAELDEARRLIAGYKAREAAGGPGGEELQRSLERLKQKQAEIEALQQASRIILSTREFPEAARHIFHACRRLIGAKSGYVALMSADGSENEVLFLFAGGLPCTVDPSLPMPIRGLRNEAYKRTTAVYENNFPGSAWARYMPPGHVALENVLFAPLLIEGKAVGVIGLANKTGGFDDRDARLANSFGELAAIALLNSRLLESLKTSEARFRSVAQTATDAIVTIDDKGLITFFNEAAVFMFGYRPEEALGMAVADLMPERFRQAHSEALKRFVDTGRSTSIGKLVERTGLKRDGSEFPLELSVAMWESGEGRHFTGILRDISGRKRDEDFIQSAMRQAEAASKAKSEFLANMSHEIRTPMNGILGMLQLLDMTSLDGEQKEYILAAIKSSKRLTRLLSDILDLSRIEAGRLALEETEFEMANQRQSVLEVFSAIAAQKGVGLDFFVDGQVPPALIGDKARLRQIIFNLVGNAIKFTEKGGVRVDVSRLDAPCDNCLRVLFTVKDTGVGIPEERLGDIFEPFVQAEGSYTRRFQGAGLGLSIVRRLVKLMGGDLSIDSAAGEGTTVYLSLPFKLSDARSGQPGPVAAPAPAPADARRRILFADDDTVSLLAGKRMLEKSGYFVVTAVNGQEALERFAGQEFDLILMDVQMPVLDGVEATKRIRASGSPRAGIPIVAMTAYAMSGDKEKFLAAGMDGYLSKPVEMEELGKILRAMLDKQRVG
ncbi:MAG: PAS domain S-box protein [Desulfovibrionaceae bacterium]|nr:PAS domain S-box protein [Desulfovibrionaceae bacterium]